MHESGPHIKIFINSAIQIVAARVHLSQDMTVCSVYSSTRCRDNNRRGGVIEQFIKVNNINILNSGSYTFSKSNIESAIDLSICSPVLQIDSQWSVLLTPRDSDHNSVLVIFRGNVVQNETITIRNYTRADWNAYNRHEVWKKFPETYVSTAAMVQDFYERLD